MTSSMSSRPNALERVGMGIHAAGSPPVSKHKSWINRYLEECHSIERGNEETKTRILRYASRPQGRKLEGALLPTTIPIPTGAAGVGAGTGAGARGWGRARGWETAGARGWWSGGVGDSVELGTGELGRDPVILTLLINDRDAEVLSTRERAA